MKIKRLSLFIVFITLILCATSISYAQSVPLPKPTNFVADYANIIDAKTEASLNKLLASFENATTTEVAVVTTPSLEGRPVDDYAVGLFEGWGIGKKGKDNGLLILVAPKEQQMRIEVGYGLEGAINDAVAGRIIRDTMIPWFKQENFSAGILNGTAEAITIVNKRYNLGFDPSKAGVPVRRVQQKKSSIGSKVFKGIFILFLIILFIKNPTAGLFVMLGMSGGRGRSSGGFGGGGGGGFGGFGGGMSGGGGASGGW